MPVNKSGLKRERQNLARRARNRVIKSKVHTSFRRLNEAIHSKNREEVDAKFKTYMSEVDKAVKRGVFHKNKGANRKSKMAKLIKVAFNEHQAA